MLKKCLIFTLILSMLIMCMYNAAGAVECETYLPESDGKWYFGFSKQDILPDDDNSDPLYIAGYNNGVEITGILDYCQARALWVDTGSDGVLVIGIDCVGLTSGTVEKIRNGLKDIPACAAINVYSTHTHAGIDSLGLWGPIGVDGKNSAYMENLVKAAVDAGHAAYAERKSGKAYYGFMQTKDMYRDSRIPEVYDANLYHIRFAADDGSGGVRMYFYGAHAESLRGDNTLLSRDFPGILCDDVFKATGDDGMYLPGAVGGLIMTKEFVADTGREAVKNLEITGEKLVGYALSIMPENEQEIAPQMCFGRSEFTTALDNPAFLLYKFLGILDNRAVRYESRTGYGVESELCVMKMGDIALVFIPGEIFPELVNGGAYGDASPENVNPPSLKDIAMDYGVEQMLIIGLANDELGYIVPPSDFLLNENAPFFEKTMDYKGENHYEETNSVGIGCAQSIAETFEAVLNALG